MTELGWDGKYKDGKKVAPVRLALPFQTIETINESGQDRQRSLDLFASGREGEWRNRLIWGDKKYVLPSLLPEFAGKVNLVYIDPPFDTGADFSFTATIPDDPESDEDDSTSFLKQPSILEQKAYRDTWGRGLASYLQWFYETATLLHELLAQDGSLYVHLDWHVGHYAKVLLDEVFGDAAFTNEVVWKRSSAHSGSKRYSPVHDSILLYSKGDRYTWNQAYQPLPQETADAWYNNVEEGTGRRFNRADLTAKGTRTGASGKPWRGLDPTKKGRHWAIPGFIREIMPDLPRDTQEALDVLDKIGRLHWPKKDDGMVMLKRYLEEATGIPALDVITDIPPMNNVHAERLGYPTQKPEALLERMISASSNEGDLVLDCFLGSGTTAAVAEKLKRQWVGCDLGRFAIHTTRKRLLAIPGVRPFIVQNLGKYERQAWHAAEFSVPEDIREREARYRRFILDLYHATPLDGHAWLHGARSGRMVHVGPVDAPVTLADVKAIAAEVWRTVGKGKGAPERAAVDILGWEFAFELNELAMQVAKEARVQVAFKKIPREVLEKRAVEQGDIRFFELAALSADVKTKKRDVTVKLTDFVVSPDDIPEEARKAIKHWSQCVDYWAIDWNYKGDTFHNEWQAYRTKKVQTLETTATKTYAEPGTFTVLVKVIDILGNDTTKAIEVEVR
jgi:DNA modification methylase